MSNTLRKDTSVQDSNVKVPAAIRAASERASALHQQAYGTETDAPQGKEPGKEPKPSTQEEPKGEPKDGVTQREPKETKPEAGKETLQEDPAPSPAEAAPRDWQNDYRAMKGRYDRQLEVNEQLASRVRELEARQRTDPPAAAAPKNPEMKFKPISQEDREAYGDDFLDVAYRAAAEKFAPEIASLRGELERLQGQVGGVTQRSQEQQKRTLYEQLDADVPNWRDQNHDPDFIAWTRLPDPYSGVMRNELMQDAFAKGDAPRLVRFFKGFLSDEATTAPASPTAAPDPKRGKVPLEQYAAPGRAKAPAVTPTPGEKETISRSQITNFYALVAHGKYRGNEAEKDRLERMIMEAEQEGRITD